MEVKVEVEVEVKIELRWSWRWSAPALCCHIRQVCDIPLGRGGRNEKSFSLCW